MRKSTKMKKRVPYGALCARAFSLPAHFRPSHWFSRAEPQFFRGSLCNSVLPVLELRRIIAATVLVHGMTIVTCNTADFELTGVQILNPWTWAGSE